MTQIDGNTPLALLTVDQFLHLFHKEDVPAPPPKRLVYGLSGIRELFHCSESRAQIIKNTIIRDAVYQHGRTIVVDADLAIELFEKKSKK